MKLNKKQKILIVKWCRETYGIPDINGFMNLIHTIPNEIIDVWKEIFPNDWEMFSRKNTIKKYPTNFLISTKNKLKEFDNLRNANKYLREEAKDGETIIVDERATITHPRRVHKFTKQDKSAPKENVE